MTKKTYTIKLEITSSSFPNHPHLAMAVARQMWKVGRDSHSISLQIGTPVETIQKIAKLENWKREERNTIDSHVGYWGPFLTEEESLELCDEKFEDDPRALKEKKTMWREKYTVHSSASSSLAWAEDTYE